MPLWGGQFRSTVWDPVLIISQIIAVQAWFYSTLTCSVGLIDLISGVPVSCDQLFRFDVTASGDLGGRRLAVAYFINAAACAVFIWLLVGRAKQCLDYACTVHLLHMLICWMYSGRFLLPVSWFLLMGTCIALTTVLSEFLSLRSELRAIPVTIGAATDL